MCGCAVFLIPLGFLHHSEATVAIGEFNKAIKASEKIPQQVKRQIDKLKRYDLKTFDFFNFITIL